MSLVVPRTDSRFVALEMIDGRDDLPFAAQPGFVTPSSRGRRAGEADLVDVRVGDEMTSDASATADDVDHARRQSGLLRRRAGAQPAQPLSARDAAAVVVRAATTDTPRFRWQTSEAAATSAGLSLHDLDGSGVVTAMSALLR